MLKKTLKNIVIFVFICINILMPLNIKTVSAAEDTIIENALYPKRRINITQGPGGSYSHSGLQAIDDSNPKDRNVYAPFTLIIKSIKTTGNHRVIVESKNPVKYANGDIDYMTMLFCHNDDISALYIGKEIKQNEVFYREGKSENVGMHVHFECGKGRYYGTGQKKSGSKYNGYDTYTINNAIVPWEALFISSDTIIETTSKYKNNWILLNSNGVTYTPTPNIKFAPTIETLKAKDEKITENNAYIEAYITGSRISSGFLFGTSKIAVENATKANSIRNKNGIWWDKNQSDSKTINYDFFAEPGEPSYPLNPGTPYYYKAFVVGTDGKEYYGAIESFTTKKSNCKHTYNTSGICNNCKEPFSYNVVPVYKTMITARTKDGTNVPCHSSPYGLTTNITRRLAVTGEIVNIKAQTINCFNILWYQTTNGDWIVYDYLANYPQTNNDTTTTQTSMPPPTTETPIDIGSVTIKFGNLNASNITQINAFLSGQINYTVGYKISHTKIYLGTSSSNMSEIFSSDTSKSNIDWNAGYIDSNWDLKTECNYTLTPDTTYYWRYGAVCDGNTYFSDVMSFKTPLKETNAGIKFINLNTSSITQTNAVLNGRVNYTIGYKISETQIYLGTSISNMPKIFSSNTSQYNINWNIGYMNSNWNLNTECGYTLAPGTTYYWRYGAVCDNVTYFSEVMGFTTLAEEKPSVFTENATLISHNNAQLLGIVNKQINVKLSEMGFYLGTSTSNMKKVGSSSVLDIQNNSTKINPSCTLNNFGVTLTPETMYYYQFYTISNGVEYKGELKNFKTLVEPINKIITITNLSAQNVTPTNASLSCSVVSTYEIFDYSDYLYIGTSASNLQSYSVGVGSLGGAKTKNLTYNVTSLSPGTTYYYQFCIRDMKTNMFYESEIKSFTTSPAPTEPPPPLPPTDVTITNLSTSGITRTNAVLNCRSYYTIGQKISNTIICIGTSPSNMPAVLNSDNSKYNINWNIGYMNSAWNLNTECGVTLSPGTTYYWRFGMVCNGYTYYSDIMSFTTLN